MSRSALTGRSNSGDLHIVSVITDLRGSTGAKLVQCEDGKQYVLKSPGNREPNLLANEFMGSLLLERLGFRTPRCCTVRIDLPSLLRISALRPSSEWAANKHMLGYHFASEYLPHVSLQQSGVTESSPDFLGIGIFDLWACNQDPRQFVRTIDRAQLRFVRYYIDNGQLFGGGDWGMAKLKLDECTKLTAQQIALVDPHAMEWIKHLQTSIPGILHEIIAAVHPTWHTYDLRLLESLLLRRLEDLPHFVGDTLSSPEGRYRIFSAQDCSYRDRHDWTQIVEDNVAQA